MIIELTSMDVEALRALLVGAGICVASAAGSSVVFELAARFRPRSAPRAQAASDAELQRQFFGQVVFP